MIELETKNVYIKVSYYTEVKLDVSLWACSLKNIDYNLVAKSSSICKDNLKQKYRQIFGSPAVAARVL